MQRGVEPFCNSCFFFYSTGLVYQSFKNLAKKFEEYTIWNWSNPISSVDLTCNIEAVNELENKILPPLCQQLNTLSKLLDPSSELPEDMNASKLQLITEIQSELDQTTDQVLSLSAGVKREEDSPVTQANDQDLKESKQFRRQGLSIKLRLMKHQLFLIFKLCFQTTKEFELRSSTNPTVVAAPLHPNRHNFNDDTDSYGVLERTAHVIESIDRVIQWIIGHEFILIQEKWGTSVDSYDRQLVELTELINRAIRPPKPEDGNRTSRDPSSRSLNQHATPVAQSLIPLTKLFRLFLKKIAKNGLNQIPSKSFTDMSSCQLATLSDSADSLDIFFYEIMRSITEYDSNNGIDPPNPSKPIDDLIHDMTRSLDSSVLLVITHVIPLITDSNSSPNLLQNYLVQWNNLFLLAAQNCICAADSYRAAQAAETDE
jgi:hypothetical protein